MHSAFCKRLIGNIITHAPQYSHHSSGHEAEEKSARDNPGAHSRGDRDAGKQSGQSGIECETLTNDPEAKYRLRVGNYRVKYNRDDSIKIIEVVRVGHRKDNYR